MRTAITALLALALLTASTSAQAAPAWYAGGTLHAVTLGHWMLASDRNRLATAADWATAAYSVTTHDELRVKAVEFVDCVNTVAKNTELHGKRTNVIVVACYALLGNS